MNARVDAEIDFDGDDLLDLLNKPPKDLTTPSKILRPARTEAAAATLQEQLRRRLDEWITSGCHPDGSEEPRMRSINRIEEVIYRSGNDQPDEFLRDWYLLSREIGARVKFGPSDKAIVELKLAAPDTMNPNASWFEAGTLIVKLVMSDLRFRISKCREPKCGKYFLLPESRVKKTYVNGIYCSTRHNRAASAAKRTRDRRKSCMEKQIHWAAEKLASELPARRRSVVAWHEDLVLVQKIVQAVNRRLARYPERTTDQIRRNWVTRNRSKIQAKAGEVARHSLRSSIMAK